jgi:hypothetical protein
MTDTIRKSVTANRLADGAVVYLAVGGIWSSDINRARIARDEAAAAALLAEGEAAAARQVVVLPYLFDLAGEDGALRPARLREVIRARGPTTGSSLRHREAA